MDNLPLLIKRKFGRVESFAQEVLDMDYRTFHRRQSQKNFRYKEIVKILKALDIRFEELVEIKKDSKVEMPPEPGKKRKTKLQKIEDATEPDVLQGAKLADPELPLSQRIQSLK